MIDSRFAGLPLAAALGRNDLAKESPAGRATSLSGFTKGHAPPPDVRIALQEHGTWKQAQLALVTLTAKAVSSAWN